MLEALVWYGLIVMFGAGAGLAVRDTALTVYRAKLRAQTHEASMVDVINGRDPEWRIDAFCAVSYAKMLFVFWRRFDAFYPNQGFTQPEGQPPV